MQRRTGSYLIGVALLLSGFDEAATAQNSALASPARSMSVPIAAVHWNAITRTVVRRNRSDPLWSVRAFALVSIAQHDAAWAAQKLTPPETTLAVQAAIASASAQALVHLFPQELSVIAADLWAHLSSLRQHPYVDDAVDRGAALGEVVARAVIRAREADGALSLVTVPVPKGDGLWRSSDHRLPLRPTWGQVAPFLITDVSLYLPPPPAIYGSPEFLEQVAKVRYFSERMSARDIEIAKTWDDGSGTITPSGHWNEIAAGIMYRHELGEVESARIFALMNMAMMDASIACWATKFQHWMIRPSHVDPAILPVVSVPDFPSYPSGHAAFSGAASAVLAYRFPSEAQALEAMAREATLSRILGGIHYPADGEAGLWQGRSVAEPAIALLRRDGPFLVTP